MPCDSRYLQATNYEVSLSRVASLLDELDGKPITPSHWEGYHPRVYSQSVDGDALVAQLCAALQARDVSRYSLEMQIWWRDHQRADKQRVEADMQALKTHQDRESAITKLTAYERQLLGV